MGSARRRKLEAALEKAKHKLEQTRARRDELSLALRQLEATRTDTQVSATETARLAARVSELRDLLAVLAPATEEEQRRAAEAVGRVREASERVQVLTRQLEAARAREDELTRDTVLDRSTIADQQAQIAEFERIEERVERFERDRAAVEASAAELALLRTRIEDLEGRLLAEADRIVELETELASAAGRIAELEAGHRFAEERIATLDEAVELAESQREAALSSLEARLSDMQRLRGQVAEARAVSETADRQMAELAEALEVAESERDAARTALEARVGDVHRLRDRIAALEASPIEGGEGPADGIGDAFRSSSPIPIASDAPASSVTGNSIELRIARVQERLEQTELRVRRALTTAEVGRSSMDLDTAGSDIVDITGRDASEELERLREEVTLLSERAASAEDARLRAEALLEAIAKGPDPNTTVISDAAPDRLPPAGS